MAAPTSQELILIEEFRSKVSDLKLPDTSDMYLLRWIRGRDHNLDNAEKMLRQHMEWRKTNDIDNILSWTPSEKIKSHSPVHIAGYDEDNSPVVFLKFGQFNLPKIIEENLRAEFLKHVDRLYIKVLDMMKGKFTRAGVPVTQFVITYDMEGISMSLLWNYSALDAAMETLRRFEANHPETLKRCYVINASRIFSLLFSMVKPLLSEKTFGKTFVYCSNDAKWKPVLQADIPLNILPECYGGLNQNFAC